MTKRVSSHRYQSKQNQAITTLKYYRDKILGLAWLGYLQYGIGAIGFREIDNKGEIIYIPRNQLFDEDVCRVVEQNDPTRTTVVLHDYGTWCNIVTLAGPKSPQMCYYELSEIFRQAGDQLMSNVKDEWG